MNIKRPFVPSFLDKLDNFLLLHKPSFWSARTHLVVYYSLLFIAPLSAVYFIAPDDARSESTVYVWVGFLSVICIIAIVAWVIYLLRFNVFKRFGIISPANTLVEFLLYFVATSVILSFCYIPLMIETKKANSAYTNNKLVNDINSINLKINQLEYSRLPKQWRPDSVHVVKYIMHSEEAPPSPDYDVVETTEAAVEAPYRSSPYRHTVDTVELERLVHNADSLQKINDSTYIEFHCPTYVYMNVYNVSNSATPDLLTSAQIFRKVIERYVAPDKKAVSAELKTFLSKYYFDGNDRFSYDNNDTNYTAVIKKKYSLQIPETSIENIAERKYRWRNDGDTFCSFWFYSSLAITLLVFVFRHSTVRTFFLSLLAIVVLSILTSLFMALTRGKELEFFEWLIVYFISFAIISAAAFRDRRRKLITGIALNLFVLMLPFIPLIATGTYYEWLERKYGSLLSAKLLINHEAMHWNFKIAEISGPVIFLLLIAVYLHPLYRQWYGLPEE